MDLSPFERYRPIIDDWDAFAAALERPLPPTIWTNTQRTTPDRLAAQIQREGFEVEPIAWYPGAFRLAPDSRPGRSLAYIAGHYHVQEEVALIPVALLDPQPAEHLLDLCAAPGNKTSQAAVHMADRGTVVANERDIHRIGVLRRNLERLGITCTAITVSDAANLPRAIGVFDRVLADVPCSCEGTSRKHPEVLRRLGGGNPRTGGQLAMLRKAVQRVRPGGRIAYSTCTYAPEENEAVVDAVLREAPAGTLRLLPARIDGLKTAPGITEWQGERWDPQLEQTMRVWPHHNDTGGFFVALIEKLENGATEIENPQPPPAIESVDPTPFLAIFEQRFGIPATVFDNYQTFHASSSIVSITGQETWVPPAPKPRTLGMPCFYSKMRSPRPTSSAVLKFGPHATRNVVDLRRHQLLDFVHTRELILDPDQVTAIDGPGWVLGRYQGTPIGVGGCWQEDGSFIVKSRVPKAWAREIEAIDSASHWTEMASALPTADEAQTVQPLATPLE